MVAVVAEDSDALQRGGITTGESGYDQSDVSGRADHWVCRVGLALPRPLFRVGVNVGDNAQLPSFADLPEPSVSAAVKHDYSGIKGGWIKIVVAYVCRDPTLIGWCEQKRAAFATT